MDFSNDIDVMARTVFGESDYRNKDDATAIALTIKNRSELTNWPSSIARVCLQPWQFSCWNQSDPQRERIIAVTKDNKWFSECVKISKKVLGGKVDDVTNRSTHYFATYIGRPQWAKGKDPVYSVEHKSGSKHLFFNNIDTDAPKTSKEALDKQRPLRKSGTVRAAAAGVSGAGAVSAAASDMLPFVSFGNKIAQYGSTAIIIILLCAIAWMLWRRYDDRVQGLR